MTSIPDPSRMAGQPFDAAQADAGFSVDTVTNGGTPGAVIYGVSCQPVTRVSSRKPSRSRIGRLVARASTVR